mgnify:CR=1 FL=1
MSGDQELRDTAVCADAYLQLTQCMGHRTVVQGLVCPHCESNDPPAVCHGEKVVRESATEEDPSIWVEYRVIDDQGREVKHEEPEKTGPELIKTEAETAELREAFDKIRERLSSARDDLLRLINDANELDECSETAQDHLNHAADELSKYL